MNINSSTKTQQKNQEWLIKEDHAIVCIIIYWIGQSKEKHNAKERSLLNGPRIKSPLRQIEEQRMNNV
jgi:hypothetical protein